MTFLYEMLFMKQLSNITWVKCEIPWNNNQLICGNDIANFCAKYIDHNLIITELTNITTIDITKLSGLTKTNTNIPESELVCFDQLARDSKKVSCNSLEDFTKNTEWLNTRFKIWRCYKQQWDGRIYVSNSDGSHHLAAVHVQATNKSLQYFLKCSCYNQYINNELLRSMKNQIEWFYLDSNNIHDLVSVIMDNYYSKNDSSIQYPVNSPFLGIKKTKLGNTIIQYMKDRNCLSLLDEMSKYLSNISI